jgi:phage-related tail protein
MLTKDDLLKALKDFRQEIREEIEIEASQTRKELKLVRLHVEGQTVQQGNRLKDLDFVVSRVEKELKTVHKDIKTLDIKVETFNTKFDEKIDIVYKDMTDGFERVIDTIDGLCKPLNKRVTKLEEERQAPH